MVLRAPISKQDTGRMQTATKIAEYLIPHVIEAAYVTPVDFLAPATPENI